MKNRRKNHSLILRGLVLVLAFALSVLCFPVDGLISLAKIEDGVTADYNYLTLEVQDKENKTTIRTGKPYTIPKAYIGGKNNGKDKLEIGDANIKETVVTHGSDKITLTDSSVTVRYGSTTASETVNLDGGKFTASKQGNYYITYSYSYKLGDKPAEKDKVYTNSYDFVITSELSQASINFNNNEKDFIPSVIDLSLAKEGNSYKKLYLPSVPEIKNEDGEVQEGVELTNDLTTAKTAGKKYVYVTAKAPNGADIEIKTEKVGQEPDQTTKYYIDGADYSKSSGKMIIRYEYYEDGEYITYSTKEVQVYPEANGKDKQSNHYKDYKIELRVASFPSTAQTRVEMDVPVATAVTSSTTTPSNESVDVYYQVEVRYMQKSSDKSYTSLKNLTGNPYKDVIDENGYLRDPKKFKPLEDGLYTFIYTVTDFYGKTDKSSENVYVIEVKDDQDPKPVVFDGSDYTLNEQNEKVYNYDSVVDRLASNANPNSVIVYAIGIDDNYSQNGDEDVELSRFIMTTTDEKYEILYYNNYNLIFNFADTTTRKAYLHLTTNNYLLGKEVDKWNTEHPADKIESNDRMLKWLKESKKGGYLIVVDEANYADIYNLFEDKATAFGQDFKTAEAFKDWLSQKYDTAEGREEIAKLGFAYLKGCTETFGKSETGTSEQKKGMGPGTYYIHYIAKDKSKNKGDDSRRIYISSYTDSEAPEINFSTQLAGSYLPTEKISFSKPTVSDNEDRTLKVRTAYRYLDEKGKLVAFEGEENLIDLDELFADLEKRGVRSDDRNQIDRYKDYNDKETDDGYKELIDEDSTTYTIDLNDAPEAAYKLQIVAWTYDDAGIPNIYGTSINIMRTVDEKIPLFYNVKGLPEKDKTYVYGEEIKLPTLSVYDDQVAHMNFDVIIKYYATEVERVDATEYVASKHSNRDGSGEYSVDGGYFVAGAAGDYQANIVITDFNNNTVVYFSNYVVEGVDIVSPPAITVDLESQTIELDEPTSVKIPTPTINYSIPKSITYDEYLDANKDTDFKANGRYENVQYVVIGVDQDHRPTDMALTSSHTPETIFTPTLKDLNKNVSIWFDVNVQVYDHKAFTFVDGSYGEKGGYFIKSPETKGTETERYYLEKDGEIVYVEVKSQVEQQTRYILRLEDEKVVVYNENYEKQDSALTDKGLTADLFKQLRCYNLKSETFYIKVQDTKGPKIKEYNYDSVMTADKLTSLTTGIPEGSTEKTPTVEESKRGILIHGIEATDASGIDRKKSKITVNWSPVDSRNGTENGYRLYEGDTKMDDAANGAFTSEIYFNKFKTVMDGTIDITYEVWDNNGNKSEWSHKIVVGDNAAPEIIFPDNWLEESYEVGSSLKVRLDTLTYVDDNIDSDEVKPEVSLTLNGDEIEADENLSTDDVLCYNLDSTGSYTLTIKVTDKVGNVKTETRTINVTARESNSAMTYQVIGTVLIVISVLVLAGVIIYFIVSKVKLDKELKK